MKKKIFVLIIILFLFFLTGCSFFNKASNKVYGCANCVYTHTKGTNRIGDVLNKYKSNYSSIHHNLFLGYQLNNDKIITAGYVCGKEKDKVFCLEGNYKKSNYKVNKKILNKVYGKEKCKEEKYGNHLYYTCFGEISVNLSNNGTNYIATSKSDQCSVNADGSMDCYYWEWNDIK